MQGRKAYKSYFNSKYLEVLSCHREMKEGETGGGGKMEQAGFYRSQEPPLS